MISGLLMTIALASMLATVKFATEAAVYWSIYTDIGKSDINNASEKVKAPYRRLAASTVLSVVLTLAAAFTAGVYA